MSHKQHAANQGLLAYGITTNPDPIQASPATGNPSLTSIVITVSNNTSSEIYCNKLTFSLPIGSLAQDVSETSTGILVSSNPSSKWKIIETSSGVFTATPVSPVDNKITVDGLSFQIFNIQASKKVGTFTMGVDELSSTDNKTFTPKANGFDLTKFPYGFYVGAFAASAPMVDDGATATLTWSGSDLAAYAMLYGKQTVDVTNVRTWTSPALTETTTFSLMATVQELGETVETYLYVTVIVANPELIATTLKVSKTSALSGPTTLGATLSVAGDSTLNNAGVSGDLNATGSVNLAGSNTAANLTVTGAAALAQAAIGSLSSTGTVNLIGAPQTIVAGSYTAPTDGFVVGYVAPAGSSADQSVGMAFCASNGLVCSATGGTIVFWMESNMHSAYSYINSNSFTMPISKGAVFSPYTSIPSGAGNANPPKVSFFWVPLGVGQVSLLSADEMNGVCPSDLPDPKLFGIESHISRLKVDAGEK